ncbi:MAG: hypothetical protein IJU03_01115 [Thermoguttaceae bacterium]|nr:hypothetical protein [Thermoguttaceae bacterium]
MKKQQKDDDIWVRTVDGRRMHYDFGRYFNYDDDVYPAIYGNCKVKEMDYETERRLGLFGDENSQLRLYAEIDEPVTSVLVSIYYGEDDVDKHPEGCYGVSCYGEGSFMILFNDSKPLIFTELVGYHPDGFMGERKAAGHVLIADPRFLAAEVIARWYDKLCIRCGHKVVTKEEKRALEKGALLSKEEALEFLEKNGLGNFEARKSDTYADNVIEDGIRMSFEPPALRELFDAIIKENRAAERAGKVYSDGRYLTF